jgi:ubiquinone/menaquinone biosynthesis C-methylase UbiE
MESIFKLYEGLKRQGSGSKTTTLHALDIVKRMIQESPVILDVGCGCGAQTLDLAENISGEITAVDIYQPYLDTLTEHAKHKDLKASIKTLNSDMQGIIDETYHEIEIFLNYSDWYGYEFYITQLD